MKTRKIVSIVIIALFIIGFGWKVSKKDTPSFMQPPAGLIEAYGGTSAPVGYLLCDGSAISRTTYANLFGIIGTSFGVGDGSTTFNIPDMRGYFPFGKATAGTGSTLGTTFGAIDHVHSVNPPNTTTGAPSATIATTNLTGTGPSATHTHDVDISAFNSASANPPGMPLNFLIKF